MQDLKLDFKKKILVNEFVTYEDQIVQSVILNLQCFKGDYYLNGDYGIDYLIRTRSIGLLIADIKEIILGTPGVTSIEEINVDTTNFKLDRILRIYATLNVDTGKQVELNGEVLVVGDIG